MSSKKWFVMLISCSAFIIAGIASLNLLADPFGVFGDIIMRWPSATMTNNPKAAKYAYIDEHVGEFEAFIIGPSGSSGISPSAVEEYTGLKCYNMFNYGADMAYTQRLARYLVENHSPKHIILVMPVISASIYDMPPEDITYYQPLKNFWRAPFLLADPKFAAKKILNYTRRGYVQQTFNVFNAADGTYDKTRREIEPISDISAYLEVYPEFADMPSHPIPLEFIDENIEALRKIKILCDSQNITLTVLAQPMLRDEIAQYDPEEVARFFEGIAEVTPFWSFVNSPVSNDPRYFYDMTHYRNSVGDMMLAKVFGAGDNGYMPENFGELVTTENSSGAAASIFEEVPPVPHQKGLTVLMYHHLSEFGDRGETISISRFREQMHAVKDAGGNTVSVKELIAYVYDGAELPDNPVLITFDDGYMSNYTYAFPILKEYGHKAVISPVGVTFGLDEYMGKEIIPHFGLNEAREMAASDLIEFSSHTYDMHNAEGFGSVTRPGILRTENETEDEYIAAFRSDFEKEAILLQEATGQEINALAYPYGLHDDLSAILLNELGVKVTFTTEYGNETVIKGLPASLLGLKRIAVGDEMTGEDLKEIILSNS